MTDGLRDDAHRCRLDGAASGCRPMAGSGALVTDLPTFRTGTACDSADLEEN